MQLAYLWIKDFNSLKQIGFNFSSKYKFEYKHKDRTIICSKNNDFIEGFFKNDMDKKGIYDLTLIIGDNGAGKTSIFQYISYAFNIINNSIQGIFIFLDNNKIKIYYNILEKNYENCVYLKTDLDLSKYFEDSNICNHKKIEGSKDNRVLYKMQNTDELIRHLAHTHFIFYSDIFSYQYLDIKNYNRFHNISTMGLIISDMKNKVENNIIDENKDKNLNFFHDDFFRQIEFVYNYKNSKEIIPFDIPEDCYVLFSDLRSIINEICELLDKKYDYNMKEEYINNKSTEDKKILLGNILKIDNIINEKIDSCHILEKIGGDDSELNINDFKIRLIYGIFIEILYNIIPRTVGKDNENKYKYINNYIESEILNKMDDLFNALISFCKNIRSNLIESLLPIDSKQIDDYIKSIKWFRDNINQEFIESIQYNSLNKRFKLKAFADNNKGSNKKSNNLKIFFEKYFLSAIGFNYLEFSWPLSSGENTFLSMFARFYSLILNNKFEISQHQKAEDIIILIDEGDITLHPEWQQKYLKTLLGYLQDIFKVYNLQLLITTHSPILLSDVPSNNVLYIKKDQNGISKLEQENLKAFASNIYDIYRKGFYLNKSNFGIIGKFALNKVENVQKKLSELREKIKFDKENIDSMKIDLENCRKIISLIGEDFIRNMLEEEYNKIYEKLYIENEENMINDKNRFNYIKNNFDDLSESDKIKFIKYVIENINN